MFKYTGFVTDILRAIPPFSFMPKINLPLPIGISFYTFQTLSYTIDVYRGDTKAQKSLVSFGTYVSFFPQLIAGPIVRYTDIAKMLDERRENISQFADGIKLWVGEESSYRKSNGCTLGYNQRNIVKRHSRCVDWHNFIRVSDIF